MGDRARTLPLLLGLLLLAIILAGVSAETNSYEARVATATVTATPAPSDGTLLVRVFMEDGANESSPGAPVEGVNVTVSQPLSSLIIDARQTNSSGEVTMMLQPGQYSVSLASSQFDDSRVVEVNESSTTWLSAIVAKHSYPAIFADLPDPESSGSVAPWSYVSIAVASTPEVPLNDSLFIDTSASGNTTGITIVGTNDSPPTPLTLGANASQTVTFTAAPTLDETPVKAVSSSMQTFDGSTVQWLTVQPEDFVQLSTEPTVSLVTYSVTLEVAIVAG